MVVRNDYLYMTLHGVDSLETDPDVVQFLVYDLLNDEIECYKDFKGSKTAGSIVVSDVGKTYHSSSRMTSSGVYTHQFGSIESNCNAYTTYQY